MNSALSLLAGAVLSGLDLGVLALAVKRLGTHAGKPQVILLGLLLVAKLGLLAGGFWGLTHLSGFEKNVGLIGLMLPFSLFIVWAFLKQKRVV